MNLLLLIVILAGFVVIIYLLQKQKSSPPELLEIVRMLQMGSKEERKILLDSLQRNTHSLNVRLDEATRVIGQVQKNVGEMSEIGRGMKDLQEFLRSPKLRGNIGEQVLKELLRQMLPKSSFHLQYTFKSGDKVDAAIKTSAGIIPIDSKFPMENFRKMSGAKTDSEKKTHEKEFVRDVKKHIDAISKKYILPQEGTIDYALMYIPSESVYYEIVNNMDLYEYASVRRVMPVSPTTFYAYMRAILMSFEGQKIEEQASQVLTTFRAIQKDYLKVEENLGILQKHLGNAYNMMSNVFSSFNQLGQKIESTKRLGNDSKEIKG